MIPHAMQAIQDFMMEYEVLNVWASAALTYRDEPSCWHYLLFINGAGQLKGGVCPENQ